MNCFKNDFEAVKEVFNGKIPVWLKVIWYITLIPVVICMMPFSLLLKTILVWKVGREFVKSDREPYFYKGR